MADGPLAFTQDPSPQSVLVGVNVQFSAQADPAPVHYQWRVNGTELSGQTNSTLELFCVSMMQSGEVYTVVATNAGGAITSAPALLQVSVPDSGRTPQTWGVNPAVRDHSFSPYWQRANVGALFNVDVFDTNLGPIWGTDTYTDDSSVPAAAVHAGWLSSGQRGTVVLRIAGEQTSYAGSTRNGITSYDYGYYAGSFQLLGLVPTITRHPKSQVRMVGGSVTYTVEAFGSGTLRYQWKHNGTTLPGETNATLQVTVASGAQAGSYAVSVMDDNGTNTSQHAILGVVPYSAGSPQTTYALFSYFVPGQFSRLVITGDTNGSIWGVGFYTPENLSAAVVHDGLLEHGETGVIAIVRVPNQVDFVGDTLNGVTSLAYGNYSAVAFLGRVPQVLIDPASQAVIAGQTAELNLAATYPSAFSIQWRKDGVNLANATNAQLAISANAPGATAVYDAVVAVPGGPNLTRPAHIFTPAADAAVVTIADPANAGWFESSPGTLVFMPLTGTTNTGSLSVWGTGIYAFGSDLAAAAVHAGRLAPGQTATVGIYTLGYWLEFDGSTRNGITSLSDDAWTAFAFVTRPSTPASPSLTMSSAGQLTIENATGHYCQIWATPTLSTSTNWSLIDSLVPASAAQAWTDPSPILSAQRFYRLALPQQ